MRRFASLDPFIESDSWSFRIGRLVANEQFLRALLRYGSFDIYHFFLADMAAVDAWKQKVVAKLPEDQLRQRVQPQPATQLRRALRDHEFAVFHQGDFTYFQPALAALRTMHARHPFPITGMTHSLDGLQPRFLQLALCGLQPYDAIICSSLAAQTLVRHKMHEVDTLLQQAFIGAGATAVSTPRIPLGLADDAFIDCAALRPGARSTLGLLADDVVFLSVGRLSMRSKTDWTPPLEQWAALRANGLLPKAVLLIAGGGTPADVAFVQSLVVHHGLRSSVRVLANFPAHQKPALFAAADVYLSLVDNFQETFGISVLEAMAAGLPVVGADFDGYRDSIVHGESGFLVPTLSTTQLPDFLQDCLGLLDPSVARMHLAQLVALDMAALRTYLLELYGNPALRQQMGTRGRAVAEAFRWPQVMGAYDALWRDLEGQARTSVDETSRTKHLAALTLGQGIDAYAHYTTAQLASSMLIALTPAGRALLEDPNSLVRYADAMAVYNPAIERDLLTCLLPGSATVQTLRARVQRFGQSAGDADAHLLWLLKHDAVCRLP